MIIRYADATQLAGQIVCGNFVTIDQSINQSIIHPWISLTDDDDSGDPEIPRIYEPIESFQQLKARLSFFMDQYNEEVRGAKMDLVCFKVMNEWMNEWMNELLN